MNRQIAKLDQMLQQTRTPENRYSMSGESTKKYNEASDDIQKCKYLSLIIIVETIFTISYYMVFINYIFKIHSYIFILASIQFRIYNFVLYFFITDLLIILQT